MTLILSPNKLSYQTLQVEGSWPFVLSYKKWLRFIADLCEVSWEEATGTRFADMWTNVYSSNLFTIYITRLIGYSTLALFFMHSVLDVESPATLYHIFWSCPWITIFWEALCTELKSTLGFSAPSTLEVCLLVILNDCLSGSLMHHVLVDNISSKKIHIAQFKKFHFPFLTQVFFKINTELPKYKIIYDSRAPPTKKNP